MNTVVVYKSISSFTKKYAEWISEELRADLLRLEKIGCVAIFKIVSRAIKKIEGEDEK